LKRRTLLTMSTAACLCGAYEAYALFISPMFTPHVDMLGGPERRTREPGSHKPPEFRRQAEAHLGHLPWAADAKFQFRNDTGFFYFREWEKVAPADNDEKTDSTGKVRFTPFAMIWRPKGHPPDKEPYTIDSESALVQFARPFELTNTDPGRVIGGGLEGKVRIRGPDNLALDGQHFNFAENALRIWSDHSIAFQQGQNTGRAQGLELDLIPEAGPHEDDETAIAGIRTVRLRKKVELELVSDPKSLGKADNTVFVDCEGNFEFDVEAHVGTFQRNVRVKRPTGDGMADKLACDLLTLIFEPAAKPAPGAAPPAATATAGGEDPGFGNLEFRRLRAEGPIVTVSSQRSEMQGWMNELTYDAQARVVVLRDAKQVRLLQKNNELLCPEVTAVLDEASQIERAGCRGAGQLYRYRLESDPDSKRTRKTVDVSAKWQKQLNKAPDPVTGLDLIEFEGHAELNQSDKMSLHGEIIRIWVTPDQRRLTRGGAETDEQTDGPDPIQPKRVLALRSVEFSSPQITGETERLEVWFEEGKLPIPPIGPTARVSLRQPSRDGAGPPIRRIVTAGATRPEPTTVAAPMRKSSPVVVAGRDEERGPARRPQSRDQSRSQSLAAVPSEKAPRAGGRHPPAAEPDPARLKPAVRQRDNPLAVTAELIQVKALRDGERTEIAEVITEGRVHVSQEHKPGEAPLDLTGDRLHLLNYAGSDQSQVLHVAGRPAHVQDRNMQLEGAELHFDRITNRANVNGKGVLRVPVPNGLDGKPLDRPQLLDVIWNEKMDFDGKVAKFYGKVVSQLNGSSMQCEEMHVTFNRRISFADEAPGETPAEIELVVCRDGVDLKSFEYEANRLVGVRTARGFEFTFHHGTGDITAQGPGTLVFWRRGNGKRAGLEPSSVARANKPLAAESAEWEYTRIDFAGKMIGNTNDRMTTFRDRVRVVHGPVASSTATIDEDTLPRDGGSMRCNELTLTQYPESKDGPAYLTMKADGNVVLDGRSFHALAHSVTYDESKGLYILSGDGKRHAKVWREKAVGAEPDGVAAQRMEFNPSRNELKLDQATGGQGMR